jgi:hypothetical protein
MSRRRKRKRTRRPKEPGWWSSIDPSRRRRALKRTVFLMAGAALLGGAAVGFRKLETFVLADAAFQQPPILDLVNAPGSLRDEILETLEPVATTAWGDPDLCRRVAMLLEANGWVARVRAVRKYADRRIEIRCDYRRPRVLVAGATGHFLVSDDRVRLPGVYTYGPGIMLVQGVAMPPPPPGEPWEAPELAAAIAIARCLEAEPYRDQITGIVLHNYGGRVDRDDAHICLATDRAGGKIVWGSAPGHELEENTAAEKIAILRENYRRFGRADAGRPAIDISTHPDRFSTPA